MDQHVIALYYGARDTALALEALLDAGVEFGEVSLLSAASGIEDCRRSLSREIGPDAARASMADTIMTAGGTAIAFGAGGTAIVVLGPLLQVAVAGYGFGGTTGGIVGALTKTGLPQPIADYFNDEVCASGAVLVGVSTLRHDDARIAAVLRRSGGASVMATTTTVYVS